jgi:hypothetical protein
MTDVIEGTMTINLAPESSVYSPHVRVLKDFIERLSSDIAEINALPPDKDGFGHIEEYAEFFHDIEGHLDQVREAAGRMLTDDFMLIVDGKRLPGSARSDI